MKVVIVGGVAGGATAATRIRRLDEKAQIIIFERSGYVSYANCGLPYYIGEVITDFNTLTLQTPKRFASRYRIDVRVQHEVLSIDVFNKRVQVKNLKTNECFFESYDKLLLSPGAKPMTFPSMPIKDSIFTLRTIEDMVKIKKYILQHQVSSAILIGGGFISLEMAENLRLLGIQTTVLQKDSHVLSFLDEDMASTVHLELKKQGISLLCHADVSSIKQNDDQCQVFLSDGSTFLADLVIVAIGVVPDSFLAKQAGLKLGIKESIWVNDQMETSISNIYAVGDAVCISHFITKQPSVIALAGPANKQARIAADNICGIASHYQGSLGTSILKVFDLSVGFTGLNEQMAQFYAYEYETLLLSTTHHASYYPHAQPLTLKVLYDKKTLCILGAQVIGYEGVDKKIDVLATAIQTKMKIVDLKHLDLAYAPPYSSVKDPLNIIGYMAENIETHKVKQASFLDLAKLQNQKDILLLDVRTDYEYQEGSIDGFLHIPLDSLREKLSLLDSSKSIYVMCHSGLRSYLACRILMQNGFDVYNLKGGYHYYQMLQINQEKIVV